MPFRFENRYVMTDEMLREYVDRVVCRGLAKNCALLAGLCALLCFAVAWFHMPAAAAVLGAFAVIGLSAGASLPFLAARQLRHNRIRKTEESVIQFGDRILVTEQGVQTWFDYRDITAVQVLRTFSVFRFGRRDAIVLSSAGFSMTDRILFWQFFREKRPDLWAKIRVRQTWRRAAV